MLKGSGFQQTFPREMQLLRKEFFEAARREAPLALEATNHIENCLIQFERLPRAKLSRGGSVRKQGERTRRALGLYLLNNAELSKRGSSIPTRHA